MLALYNGVVSGTSFKKKIIQINCFVLFMIVVELCAPGLLCKYQNIK